ncbi:MAG: hypothetical protein ACTHNP_12290 [Solirubrobacterales bacterium]
MHYPGQQPSSDHGRYHVVAADPISVPRVPPNDPMEVDFFGPPPDTNAPDPQKRKQLAEASDESAAKRARVDDPGANANPDPNPNPPVNPAQPPAPPPAPDVDFVGIMDVGQGNCNLLVKNGQPQAYFDVGFPPHRMVPSAPAGVNGKAAPAPPKRGPITQNSTNSLYIVLSHWDWDHYQLAEQWPALKALPWYVPAQPGKGPKARGFFEALPNKFVVDNAMTLPMIGVIRCHPGNLPRSAILNNSGLAIATKARLPAAGADNRVVLLPADASMQSLQGPRPASIGALTAVHHGSRRNRAADNLPNPAVAGQGRIVYSYGILPDGEHTYGFPTLEALNNWRAAGWTTERSTAQGGNITDGSQPTPYPLLNRGNVRIAAAGALDGAYANTAFHDFGHVLD